jgi:hypothetical protein
MVIAENDFSFKIIHPVKLAIDELELQEKSGQLIFSIKPHFLS